MSKRVWLIIGYLLLVVALFASLVTSCAKPAPSPTPAPTPAPAPEYQVRFSSTEFPLIVHWRGMEQVFKPIVEVASQGRISVELIGGGALGKPAAQVDMMKSGAINMLYTYFANHEGYARWSVLAAMFWAYPDHTSAMMHLESIRPELNKMIAPENIVILGFFDFGGQQIIARDKFYKKPEDLKGKTARSVAGGVDPVWVESLGAKPVIIPAAEVYSAFEQGIADLTFTFPISGIWGLKMYEVTPYATVINHKRGIFSVSADLSWWNGLPDDIKDIIQLGVQAAADWSNMQMLREEVETTAQLRQAGQQFYWLNEEEKEAFRESVRPVYEWAYKEYGKDIVDLFVYKVENKPPSQ